MTTYRAKYTPFTPWAYVMVDVIAHYGKKALVAFRVDYDHEPIKKLVFRSNLEAV